MRIRIRHETRYRYERPARGLAQVLRLTPRSYSGQHVAAWRVDLSLDVPAPTTEDAYGNLVQTLFAQGPVTEFVIEVTGEVETFDVHGVVEGAPDPLPAEIYRRLTPLTQPTAEIRAFAREHFDGAGGDVLERLHALMLAVGRTLRFEPGATGTQTSAGEAFAAGAGVCQDLAHVFIGAARDRGVAARYVSGHLHRPGEVRQEASHAWAEALVPGLGWVGFDPTNGISPTEHHVRVAAGLDYAAAAPVRGVRTGGGRETLGVVLDVADMARGQRQS